MTAAPPASLPRAVECSHVRLRGATWLRSLASGSFAVALFAASCTATASVLGLLGGLLAALALTGAVHVLLSALAERSLAGGSAILEPDGGVTVMPSGRHRISLAKGRVRSGYEDPVARAAVLQLDDGSEIVLGLGAECEPDEVLAHVGVAAVQRSLTLPLRGAIGAGTLAFMGFTGALVATAAIAGLASAPELSALSPIVGVVAAAALARWLGRPRVTIGLDGLALHGALGRRFIPFAEVTRIDARGAGLLVTTASGRALTLPLLGMGDAAVGALRLRVERAAEARKRSAGARRAYSLARAGRTVEAWRADVKRLAASEQGFRRAAVGAADFEHLLRDGSAPTDERVGAALALRVAAPDAAARQIRAAIESAADASLRDALTAALEDDEEAIDEATRASES